MTIRKVDPQPSAPRPVVVAKPPAAIVPPKPLVAPGVKANINAKTGRTSSFEAFKPAPIAMDNRTPEATSEGRGTNDDSIGRGTNDDSIGRGTNDDSIGSGTGTTRPPDDVGVGSVEEPTARGPALIAGREGLSADITAKMDQLTAAADPERAQQASYIFNTPEFQAMPAEQRAQIVTVMSAGDIRVARGMAEMFEQSGGAMLQAAGKDGTTVLDSLVRMAAKGDGVVGDVMYDLVNPGRIWQGRAPTCTVSSMQYELAQQDPAEYARLMAGLVCDGKVTMRGGGELTCDVPWALQASHAAKDRRSDSEAIFQAAAMEFANGDDTYLEYGQQSVGGSESYRGLRADQIRNMVGELFGVAYVTKQIGSDTEATAELNEILARESPSRPVLFDIMVDGSDSNHCVSLEGVKNGRVYYRDPTTGERESMSVEEFRQSLVAVHYAPPPTPGFFGSMVGRFKNLLF